MAASQMEQQLENLDRGLVRIQQILPGLATTHDVQAFATKDDVQDLRRRMRVLHATLRDDSRLLADPR